jgi:toxin-antitoxin system PIN domain toxin
MSRTCLLDANVLIAASFRDHVHHRHCNEWLAQHPGPFATCPTTQAALVRFVVRTLPQGNKVAKDLLESIIAMSNHTYWPDDLGYTAISWPKITGHRQVTDAYLVALSLRHGGTLLTLDQALATIHPGVELIPT